MWDELDQGKNVKARVSLLMFDGQEPAEGRWTHSFNKNLLSKEYVSSTFLGTEDTAGNKTKFLTSWGLCSGWRGGGRQTMSQKKVKCMIYYVMIRKLKQGRGNKKCWEITILERMARWKVILKKDLKEVKT